MCFGFTFSHSKFHDEYSVNLQMCFAHTLSNNRGDEECTLWRFGTLGTLGMTYGTLGTLAWDTWDTPNYVSQSECPECPTSKLRDKVLWEMNYEQIENVDWPRLVRIHRSNHVNWIRFVSVAMECCWLCEAIICWKDGSSHVAFSFSSSRVQVLMSENFICTNIVLIYLKEWFLLQGSYLTLLCLPITYLVL